MDLLAILLLAVGLAMDAFSVSITRGLSVRCDIKHALTIALLFGGFQALMPVLGWASGRELASFMNQWAPWVAFTLLVLIGVKMIYESFHHPEEEEACATIPPGTTISVGSNQYRCLCRGSYLCLFKHLPLTAHNHHRPGDLPPLPGGGVHRKTSGPPLRGKDGTGGWHHTHRHWLQNPPGKHVVTAWISSTPG